MNHTERKLHERVGILEAEIRADRRLRREVERRHDATREATMAMIASNQETYLRGHAELTAKIDQGLTPLREFMQEFRGAQASVTDRRTGATQRATIVYSVLAAGGALAAVIAALVAVFH